MNSPFLLTLVSLSLLWSSSVTFAKPPGVSVIRDLPEAAFAPPGFDSNDHSQVVVAGTFTSSCFKAGSASADVNPLTKTIQITQKAYVLESSWCLQMLVPYSSVVDVGILPPGDYQVQVVSDLAAPKTLENLSIAPASESVAGPDESLYAIAEDVSLENGVLKLRGKLPGACVTLKDIRVLTRKSGIVEVLPLLQTKQAQSCAESFISFEKEIPVSLPWKGRTLLHVRSLNGQALNKIVEVR